MIDHKCQYADAIGRKPEWQTDEDGKTVCVFCHVDKKDSLVEAIKDSGDKLVSRAAVTKTLRK